MKRVLTAVFLIWICLLSGCAKEEPLPILGQNTEKTGTFQYLSGAHTYTMELSVDEEFLYDLNFVSSEETYDYTRFKLYLDNGKEYLAKLDQLHQKYREIYAEEIEKNGFVEFGADFEAEYNEFADEEPDVSCNHFVELSVIRYEPESKKATMYVYCGRGNSYCKCIGESFQGFDDTGMGMAYPGYVVYAETKLYLNGELKDTVTLGTYIEPDETTEVDWVAGV